MGTPNYPPDLGDDLATIRSQLRAALILARSSVAKTRIYASTLELVGRLLIKAGGRLEVQNAVGATLINAGRIPLVSGAFADGIAIFRPDGTGASFVAYQPDDTFLTSFRDKAFNELVGPDETSGQGISRPWLTHSLYPTAFVDLVPTTSATFVTLWSGSFFKQQPVMQMVGKYGSDSATSGELRVLVNGIQWGATVAIPLFVQDYWGLGPLDIAGAHMAYLEVQIQARRTAGAGSVKCAPVYLVTRGSV